MESANYREIKTLAGFMEKCEEMLKEADGLPDKQKSILERLEKCRSRLHLLLAGATLEAIHSRADGLSSKFKEVEESIIKNSNENKNEIIDHIQKPVVDDKNKFKRQVIIILRKGNFSISDEGIFSGKGILEINDRKKIFIAPPQFLLLYVLAKGSQFDTIPIENRFYNDLDIKDSVNKWKGRNVRYVAVLVKRLKDMNHVDCKDLIEGVYGKGYRISIHPQNIKIDEDVELILQKEIDTKKLTERILQ